MVAHTIPNPWQYMLYVWMCKVQGSDFKQNSIIVRVGCRCHEGARSFQKLCRKETKRVRASNELTFLLSCGFPSNSLETFLAEDQWPAFKAGLGGNCPRDFCCKSEPWYKRKALQRLNDAFSISTKEGVLRTPPLK